MILFALINFRTILVHLLSNRTMFRKCCVPTCNSQRKDVKLHRFPVNIVSRHKWLKCIGDAKLQTLDLDDKVFVCQKHFEQRFINQTSRLISEAYPTLFSELEISSGIPSHNSFQSDPKPIIVHRLHDHTYCKAVLPSASTENVIQAPDCATPLSSKKAQRASPPIIAQNNTPPSSTMAQQASPPIEVLNINEDGTPTSRYGKKKLIRDVKSLTPKCRLLYKEFKKVRRQRDVHIRAKKCIDFTKENSFENLTKSMNPLAKTLLWMQVKMCTKKKSARRFTMDEKLIGLAVYKQSPKSYKFLQKIFILPSKTTLKKMISGLNIDAGINPQIFELIKEQVRDWKAQKKLCTIIFDEMSLEPAMTFIPTKDQIDGFVHLNTKKNQFADQALVFMVRGAVYKWQQPIAYYFCEGQTKTTELKNILTDIVAAVTATGLKPIAFVSDQGTSFQASLNNLLEETRANQLRAGENVDNTIHLSGNTLSVIYDPDDTILSVSLADGTGDLMEGHRILEGGEYTPQDCKPKFSTAIIVPYRDRAERLRSFLVYMHTFFRRQRIHYRIYVIEQVDTRLFNRAKLLNIGAMTAMKAGYPCLVLHDVDLLPLRPANLYACTMLPRHMSANINKFRFVLTLMNYISGAISIASKQYKAINGMSNEYYGWGGEDDDLYYRLKKHNIEVCRFEPALNKYYSLGHQTPVKGEKRTQLANLQESEILADGLSSMKYTEVATVLHPLFTHIMVDL